MERKPLQIDFTKSKYKEFPKLFGMDVISKSYQIFKYKPELGKYCHHKLFNVPINIWENHFNGHITYGLRLYKHTKLVYIDIDVRSQNKVKNGTKKDNVEKAISLIKEELGNPIYIEQNKDGNTHLILDLKYFLADSARKYLERRYKEVHGVIIEVVRSNGFIRVPFSKDYQYKAIGFSEKLEKYIDLKTPYELLKCLKEKTTPLKLPNWLIEKNKFGDAVYQTPDRQSDIVKKYIKKSYELNESKDFNYGCGTRYRTQLKIGINCFLKGMDFEDFIDECEYWNDGTSKDMKSEDYIDFLDEVWSWVVNNIKSLNTNYASTRPDTYQYDEEEIPDKYYKKLRFNILRAFTIYYKQEFKSKVTRKNIHDLMLLIENITNHKNYRNSKKYKYKEKNKNLKHLNDKSIIPLDKQTILMMAKEHRIGNIWKLMKFLQWSGFLRPIPVSIPEGTNVKKLLTDPSYKHPHKHLQNFFFYSYKGYKDKKRSCKHYQIAQIPNYIQNLTIIHQRSLNNSINRYYTSIINELYNININYIYNKFKVLRLSIDKLLINNMNTFRLEKIEDLTRNRGYENWIEDSGG